MPSDIPIKITLIFNYHFHHLTPITKGTVIIIKYTTITETKSIISVSGTTINYIVVIRVLIEMYLNALIRSITLTIKILQVETSSIYFPVIESR